MTAEEIRDQLAEHSELRKEYKNEYVRMGKMGNVSTTNMMMNKLEKLKGFKNGITHL